MAHYSFEVTITRFVLECQPNIVECQFTDAYGREWLFHDKSVMFTLEYLDEASDYPRTASIVCEILSERSESIGRTVATILPTWALEATSGETQFEIERSRLSQLCSVGVTITRYVSSDEPGVVECLVTDAHGKEWYFHNHWGNFTHENLKADADYPKKGTVTGTVISSRTNLQGRKLALVDTFKLWGNKAITGETQFELLADSLSDPYPKSDI